MFIFMVNVSKLRLCIFLINKKMRSNHCELSTLPIEQHLNLEARTTRNLRIRILRAYISQAYSQLTFFHSKGLFA